MFWMAFSACGCLGVLRGPDGADVIRREVAAVAREPNYPADAHLDRIAALHNMAVKHPEVLIDIASSKESTEAQKSVALIALGDSGTQQALHYLVQQSCQDTTHMSMPLVIQGLGKYKQDSAVQALLACFGRFPAREQSICRAMGECGDSRFVPILLAHAWSGGSKYSSEYDSILALRRIPGPESRTALISLVGYKDQHVAACAAAELASFADNSIDALLPFLNSEAKNTRDVGIVALGAVRGKKAMHKLEQMFRAGSVEVRSKVVEVCMDRWREYESARAWELCVSAKNDPSPRVRDIVKDLNENPKDEEKGRP